MNKIINIVMIAFLLIFISAPLAAVENTSQGSSGGEFIKVGAAGAQFLKIGVGARANGMAGAYTAVANDLSSIYWNPAGLADVKAMGADFSYTQWFAGFSHGFAGFSIPLGENFTTAVSIVSFNSDRIPVTTIERPEGTGSSYTVNDVAINATIAGYLTEQFSFGVTFKYINNSFSMLNSGGVAFDIGTMYETGIQGIKLGFSILNLGTEQTYRGQDLQTTRKYIEDLKAAPLDVQFLANAYSIPLIFRAGAASDIINSDEHKLIADVDFAALSDTKEQFAIGLEYTWNKLISLRGGYRFGQDQLGLTGGIGLNYIGSGIRGQFDYSVSPTKDLGLINRLSINVIMK